MAELYIARPGLPDLVDFHDRINMIISDKLSELLNHNNQPSDLHRQFIIHHSQFSDSSANDQQLIHNATRTSDFQTVSACLAKFPWNFRTSSLAYNYPYKIFFNSCRTLTDARK